MKKRKLLTNGATAHILTSLFAAGLLALLVYICGPAGAAVLEYVPSESESSVNTVPNADVLYNNAAPAQTPVADAAALSEPSQSAAAAKDYVETTTDIQPAAPSAPSEEPAVQMAAADSNELPQSSEPLTQSYTGERTVKQTPAKAAPRTFYVEPNGVYRNMLSSISEVVRYEFSVTERGALQYTLSNAAGENAAWKARLFQEYYINGMPGETALRQLNTLTKESDQDSSATPHIGLQAGRYVIEISCAGAYSAVYYNLELKFVTGTGFEIEYNDSVTRYTEIWPGVAVRGSACARDTGRDTDWYYMHLYTPTALEFIFTHPKASLTTVAFKIYIYSSDMQELYSGSSPMDSESITSGVMGLPPGDYYIQVQSRIYIAHDYTLTPKRHLQEFEEEPNDTFAAATLLNDGVPLYGALTNRTGNTDRDCYRIALDTPGYIDFYMANTVIAEETTGYIRRMTLFDADGNAIYRAMITDRAAKLRSPSVGVAPGSYYLCVDKDNLYENNDTYEIGYSFTSAADWEHEYNNLLPYANAIADGVPVTGTLSDAETVFDTDWFTFTTDEACNVTLKFAHEALEGENDIFNVTLCAADGSPLGETLLSLENSAEVSMRAELAPGTYYVKVTSGRYNAQIRYTLTCSLEK